jgi:DnaJ-domain-containing protein 1
MQLPAALEQTTLGDLLGTLHRGRAYGALELVEMPSGWVHQIQVWDGYVVGVQVTRGCVSLGEVLCRRSADPLLPGAVRRALQRLADGRPLGERLLAAGVVSRAQLNAALLELYRERLDFIERLPRAQVRFRPLRAAAKADLRLGPESFLHGRRRSRPDVGREGAPSPPPNPARAMESSLASDYQALGLLPSASLADVKQAFRAAVRRHHPDKSAHLGERAVKRAELHFRSLMQSYERICSRQNVARVA